MTRHLWNMQSWITWVWEYLEFELKESKLLMDILRNYFSLTLRYATAWDVCWRKIICKKLRSFLIYGNSEKLFQLYFEICNDLRYLLTSKYLRTFEKFLIEWEQFFMKILRNNCIVNLRYATNLDVSSHQVVWEHLRNFKSNESHFLKIWKTIIAWLWDMNQLRY